MKIGTVVLKVAIPVIILWLLLTTNVWLGIAGACLYLGYGIARGQTFIYASLGNVNYQRGKLDDAFKWFDKAVSRKDARPSHLIGYGFLLLKHGGIEQAGEMLERAGKLPLSREEKMNLEANTALLLWKKGRLPEAKEKMEALYQDYKNTYIYSSLGYFYILSGDLDQALAFNREAYEFNEAGTVILDNLGQTHLLRGEYAEALKLYEKLAALNPTFPEAYYNHGLVLEALGRREEALERLRQSLDYPISLLSTVTREELEGKLAELEQERPSGSQL